MRRTLITVFFVSLLLPEASMCQSFPPGGGFPQYGSVENFGIDAVNLQNLNSFFSAPVIDIQGRQLGLNFDLTYNSAFWVPFQGSFWASLAQHQLFSWWNPGLPGGILTFQRTYSYCGSSHFTYLYTYSSGTFLEANGTAHKFSVNYTYNQCTHTGSGTQSGFATDGSGFYLAAIYPSAVVYSPSGEKWTGYYASSQPAMTDTNGNFVTSTNSGSDWTDTLGRTALEVSYSQTTFTYSYQDSSGNYQTLTMNVQSFPVQTNFGCPGITEATWNGYGQSLNPTSIVLPNGQQYSFSYEATPGYPGWTTGRISQITLPNGGYIQYQYGGSNDGINCADGTITNLTRIVNDGTNTYTWTYNRTQNGSNWVTTETAPQMPYDSAANQTVYTFNSSGQEISRQLYQGSASGGTLLRTINTTWASNGSPATKTTILEDNSTQSEVETTYDNYGNLLTEKEHDYGTGAPGSILRTSNYTMLSSSAYTNLNILNRVTRKSVSDSTGVVKYREDTAYDGATLGPCPTGATQHDDTNYGCSFTTRGNPTSLTTYTDAATPAGAETKNSYYDVFGNLVQADVDCCQSEKWTFSGATQYAYPDSLTCGTTGGPQTTTSYTYNGYTGQLATETDANNQQTSYTNDTMLRPLTTTLPDLSQPGFTYDDVHYTVTIKQPINSSNINKRIPAQDGLGRTVSAAVQDASGNTYSTTQRQYDALNRLYKQSNPYTTNAQYWVTTQYDALGRKTKEILQDNSQNTYAYSTTTITTTDPAGHQRKSQLDGLGRLVILTEPDPTNGNSLTLQTSFAYTVLDKQSKVTQGVQARTFNYDGMGRLTSEIHPESGTTGYQYNNFDLLTQRTDNRGVITTYSYDTMNRPYQIVYNVGTTGVPATPTVTYTYGTNQSLYNNGRLLTLADGVGTRSYSYDNMGRTTQELWVIGGTNYPVGYQYNNAGQVTALTYPSGRVVQQNYDPIGRVSSVASGTTTFLSGMTYDAGSALTGFNYGNGITAGLSVSPDRRQLQGVSYLNSGATLYSENFTYGTTGSNDNHITAITDYVDAGRSTTYTYDALERLTSATTQGSANYAQWGLSWVYDRYGNRLSQTVTAGTGPSNSVNVNAATNQITTSGYSYDSNGNMTNDGTNSLVYDAENRVVSADGTTSYLYEGTGRRVQKTTGASTTAYIFAGNSVVAEYSNGVLNTEYIYGGTSLIAEYDGGTLSYHGRDQLSIRLNMDTSGNNIGEQGHYPFGEDWYLNNSTTKWHFTSYERDPESGNDYAKYRYNVNRLGRFLSTDPVAPANSEPQFLNRYSYVASEPINRRDPTGRNAVDDPFDCAFDFGDPFCVLGCDPIFGCGGGCDPEFGDCTDVSFPPPVILPPPPPSQPTPVEPGPPPNNGTDKRIAPIIERPILSLGQRSPAPPPGTICDCQLAFGTIRLLGCSYECTCSNGQAALHYFSCPLISKGAPKVCPFTVVLKDGVEIVPPKASLCN